MSTNRKSYWAKVRTPTLPRKKRFFVFNCEGMMVDGTVDKWIEEKLTNYFHVAATNKPIPFELLEYASLNDQIKEIKL